MVMSADEFLAQPYKRITLMGMSGVGKTYLSELLAEWGWDHLSCDFVIGNDYLRPELARDISVSDMSALSEFVGKVGAAEKGGLELAEFQRRQKLYYDAECQSLRDALALMAGGDGRGFINDSTGSFCEIEDEELIQEVGRKSLIVYIEASETEREQVLQRALDYPKPLFFPKSFFEASVRDYMRAQGYADVQDIDPDEFSRWIFPALFAARLPKYERIAGLYGVTVPSQAFQNVPDEAAFLDVIAGALRERDHGQAEG